MTDVVYGPGNCWSMQERLEVERWVITHANRSGRRLCLSDVVGIADRACERLNRLSPWKAAHWAWKDHVRTTKAKRKERLLGDSDSQVESRELPPLPGCFIRLVRQPQHRLLVVALSEGHSLRGAARAVGVSVGTASRWLVAIRKDLALFAPDRHEPLTEALRAVYKSGRIR